MSGNCDFMENKLECYICKGTYFKVICKQHEYDTVDVFALKCVECGHEIVFQDAFKDLGIWRYIY